jgi:hypothetical protein
VLDGADVGGDVPPAALLRKQRDGRKRVRCAGRVRLRAYDVCGPPGTRAACSGTRRPRSTAATTAVLKPAGWVAQLTLLGFTPCDGGARMPKPLMTHNEVVAFLRPKRTPRTRSSSRERCPPAASAVSCGSTLRPSKLGCCAHETVRRPSQGMPSPSRSSPPKSTSQPAVAATSRDPNWSRRRRRAFRGVRSVGQSRC